ncbi:Tenascin-X [Portunus trituberculatus]|uniref:Tenascin-X n=1 Tax=Portunus trituberculatus TaxID=210409 RepID=A0A5B7D561_PORTR|nr:Tenascin-X [Portunus trituberculatus]
MAVVLWAILLNTMVTLAGKPQAILGLQHRLLKTSNNLRMDRGDIYGDKGFGLNNILPWWTLKGNEKHPMTAKPRSAPKKKNEALSVPVGVMTSNNYTKKKMMHYEHDGMVRPVTVYCDMETRGGGWLEVQRRRKNIEKHVNFTRGWNSYKLGFGNPETEFWLGLENLHILTNRQKYELRIDLKSEDGKTAYAQYDNFYVDEEGEDYRLHVSGFMGTAGDAFGGKYDTEDGGDIPRGVPFSTVDRDRSSGNCSSKYCGGWWYLNCGWNRLNSPHFSTIEHYRQGMKWSTFTAKVIEDSTMMIRPVANSDISTELSTCTCAREVAIKRGMHMVSSDCLPESHPPYAFIRSNNHHCVAFYLSVALRFHALRYQYIHRCRKSPSNSFCVFLRMAVVLACLEDKT